MQFTALPSIDLSSGHGVQSLNMNSKSSNLPSLVNVRNKNSRHKIYKKQKIQKYTVAQSDIDSNISSNVKFCSIRQESSDITFESYTSADFLNHHDNIIKISKDFDSNRPNDFNSLFEAKCNMCSLIIDNYHCISNFQNSTNMINDKLINESLAKDKENKKTLLKQLSNSLQYPLLARKITSKEIQLVVNVFAKNIFRSFPTIGSFQPSVLFDCADSFHDDAWDQISNVYIFFISFVKIPYIEQKHLMHSISPSFVKNLFLCFNSPDDRERNQVLETLFSISCRLPERCTLIFHLIKNTLIDSIYKESNYWGLSQILELLSKMMRSIPQFLISLKNIQSFKLTNSLMNIPNQNITNSMHNFQIILNSNSTSLNPETILEHLFLSLHQLSNFPSFSSNLLSCIELYMQKQSTEKSSNFLDQYIIYFMSHYPIASQKKQIVYLKEIQQIISKFSEAILPNTAIKLINFIGRNLFNSPCIDISEKSMSFIFESSISTLINQYYSQILPVLYVNIRKTSKTHYDDYIRGYAMAALQELSRINHKLFDIIVDEIHQNSSNQKHKKNDEFENASSASSRQKSWEIIKAAANANLNTDETKTEAISITTIYNHYNNENGNDNASITNKKDNFETNKSKKNRLQNYRLSVQDKHKICTNTSLLKASIKQKDSDYSSGTTIYKNHTEINFNKSNIQNEQEVEKKVMMSQPLPVSMIKRSKLAVSRSPRITSKEIVRLNSNNLKRQRK